MNFQEIQQQISKKIERQQEYIQAIGIHRSGAALQSVNMRLSAALPFDEYDKEEIADMAESNRQYIMELVAQFGCDNPIDYDEFMAQSGEQVIEETAVDPADQPLTVTIQGIELIYDAYQVDHEKINGNWWITVAWEVKGSPSPFVSQMLAGFGYEHIEDGTWVKVMDVPAGSREVFPNYLVSELEGS